MNCPHCQQEIDLHEHDAEVREPLVEALEDCVLSFREARRGKDEPPYIAELNAERVLAKVNEQ